MPSFFPADTFAATGDVLPRHIAIVPDGNGRWATRQGLPRIAGHRRGFDAVRRVVEACARRGVGFLTIYAFSSENLRRPPDEVAFLTKLMIVGLRREVSRLRAHGIRLRIVGDVSALDARIQRLVDEAESLTAHNTGLTLTIAANYGGRWDILQATRKALANAAGADIDETRLAAHLAMAHAPEPDLLIRTSGEQRISNFLLWHLAYTELYFTEQFWPEFDEAALDVALDWYARRDRRHVHLAAQERAAAAG